MQDEPMMNDEQRTVLAANNSGLDFLTIPTKVNGGEVIEILDNVKEDVLNEYKQEEVLVKIEPEQMDGAQQTAAGVSKQGDSRRSGRTRIVNRWIKD